MSRGGYALSYKYKFHYRSQVLKVQETCYVFSMHIHSSARNCSVQTMSHLGQHNFACIFIMFHPLMGFFCFFPFVHRIDNGTEGSVFEDFQKMITELFCEKRLVFVGSVAKG